MADEVKIQIDLEAGDIKTATNKIENEAKKTGDKAGKNIEAGFNKGLSSLTKIALGAIATIGSAFATRAVIAAASQQEEAINNLNTALALTGQYSHETSQRLQEFANQMEGASKFGADRITESMAKAQGMLRGSEEELKRTTQAAINLSSALGVNLDRSFRILARASEGSANGLRRFGISVQEGATNAETFENTLKTIESRFGGAAQAQVNTFAGAVSQVRNAFDSLLTEVGKFLTRSPEITFVFKKIGEFISPLTNNVSELGSSFSILESAVKPLVSVGEIITNYVIPPIELLYNIGSIVFNGLVLLIDSIVARFGLLGGAIAKALNLVGIENDFTESLTNFMESSEEVAMEQGANLAKSLENIMDFSFQEKSEERLDEFKAFVNEMEEFVNESRERQIENLGSQQEAIIESNEETAVSFWDMFSNITIGMENSVEKIKESAKQISQTIKSGLINSISGGIQSVINSITAGEDAFANLGKFMLNTFGDMAIQMGQQMMMTGIAVEALKALGGGAAIAAGAGLVAVGTIMKNMAGGGGSTGSSGSVSSPSAIGGDNFDTGVLSDPQEQRREEQASVNLTIQGDVLDSEESGLRIAQLISDAAGKTGVVLRGATI